MYAIRSYYAAAAGERDHGFSASIRLARRESAKATPSSRRRNAWCAATAGIAITSRITSYNVCYTKLLRSVTAAFARLAATSARAAMICDLDVDAADLHLLLAPEVLATAPFSGGRVATLDSANCAACGVCEMRCRYGAVREDDDGFAIDAVSCEGCGVCAHFCPSGAIRMMPRRNNFV